MDRLDERAQLGRIEPWLRAVAVVIWAFVGLSRLPWGPHGGLVAAPIWLVPWSVYGAALLVTFRARDSIHRLALALQSGSAIALPLLGLTGFEGLLLAIIVAEAPVVLSFRRSVGLAVAQSVPLFAVVYRSKNATELMEIHGAYSAFSAFALLVYWLHLQERQVRRELAETNAALLSTRALIALGSQQGERLRICAKLHDSLGHHLTALNVHLALAGQLAEGGAAESITRARAISREALDEVRRVVSTMQSSATLDLVAALKAVAAGIPMPRISIRAEGDLGLASIGSEASHALFRCVQEAITNTLKHASARNVWIEITRDEASGRLDVRVRDDGAGARTLVRGTGLEGIEARALQIGGRAELTSRPGHGFEVHISIPKGAVAP